MAVLIFMKELDNLLPVDNLMKKFLSAHLNKGLWLACLSVLSMTPSYADTPLKHDQIELSPAESRSAIEELRQKQLIFPVQGINPETVKGSFAELRGNELHHAVDISAPRNTPVLAAGDGKIGRLWLSKAGGNTIYEIDPSGKYSYYYAHLEHYADNLKEGQPVKKGEVIGFVGTSGDAPKNAPHLHFSFGKLEKKGVWWPSGAVDPYEVYSGKEIASAPASSAPRTAATTSSVSTYSSGGPPPPPPPAAPAAPAKKAMPPAPATAPPPPPAPATTPPPQPSPAKPVRHGAIDGSFSDGKLELGKTIPVNGFHKGLPTLILVDMGSHTTFVLQKQANDRVVKVYSASDSVGSDKTPTPPGPYWVAVKLKFPVWLPPKDIDPKQKPVQPYNKDHKNPLGVARIGLNKWGINLHGTNQPGSIRKSVSHGCIRHSNQDIMKIYDMVDIGTPVIIADQFVGTTLSKDSFDLHGKQHNESTHSKKKSSKQAKQTKQSKHNKHK